MARLDFNDLFETSMRSLPASAQTAQIRVISGFPAYLSSWQAATDRMIRNRKGHIDETAESAPIDDTVDLEDEILRSIIKPAFDWAESRRPYHASVFEALGEENVSVPPFPALWLNVIQHLVEIVENAETATDKVLVIPKSLDAAASGGSYRIAPIGTMDNDETEVKAISTIEKTVAWTSVVAGFDNDVGLVSVADTTRDGVALSSWEAGYTAGLAKDAFSFVTAEHSYGYLCGWLHQACRDQSLNGTDYEIDNMSITPPSLISDIALAVKAIRDFIEGPLASYGGLTIDMFITANDTLLDAV